jgi:sodium-dependent dicarboxylate transporter 2/3/5
MGTVIGSPPNAIAAGALEGIAEVDFIRWMAYGLPPGLILTGIIWYYLKLRLPKDTRPIDLSAFRQQPDEKMAPMWQRLLVMIVFFLTVALWVGGPFIGLPAAVVSFVPITVFAVTGIVGVKEIRELNWDILLLLAGGLALGVAVSQTKLAEWLVKSLHITALAPLSVAVIMACACSLLSNFMSNTAAANVLVPLGLAVGQGGGATIVISLGLAASTAMCLPISTPPNAIAFSTGRLRSSDFIKGGLVAGVLAIALIIAWVTLLQRYVF